MAVPITDKEKFGKLKLMAKHTCINIHNTGGDSGLYLSMLSSQVSPTRSLSESDCRKTKQTLCVKVMTAGESLISRLFGLLPGSDWPYQDNCHRRLPPRHGLCLSGLGWGLAGSYQEYSSSLRT